MCICDIYHKAKSYFANLGICFGLLLACVLALVFTYTCIQTHTRILTCAHAGDKFNVIFAEMINPKMSAELYLDGKEHESEIKQVLGDTYSSHNLTDDDVLIIGRAGLMITGVFCIRSCMYVCMYVCMTMC
jgi:hypothetical protein